MFRDRVVRVGRALVAAVFFAQAAMMGTDLVARAIEHVNSPPRTIPMHRALEATGHSASPGAILTAALVGALAGFCLVWRRGDESSRSGYSD